MYLRLLSSSDYKDYMELINEFRPSTLTSNEFDTIHSMMDTREVWVAVDNISQKIIGTGTLIYEHKFIHNGGVVSHIEDVVISKEHKGKGYGKFLIEHLTRRASYNKKCYKVILNCSEEFVLFYEKCGYTCTNLQMEYRF